MINDLKVWCATSIKLKVFVPVLAFKRWFGGGGGYGSGK